MRSAVLVFVFASAADAAWAQSAPLIIDQGRADRAAPRRLPPGLGAPAGKVDIQARGAAAALIRVRITGSSLAPNLLTQTWRPFIGKPLDANLARAIATALSENYAKSDIALYAVKAPRRDLRDGVLDLAIVEGHIANVVFTPDGAPIPKHALSAQVAKLTSNRPLRRAVLEREISLMRETPGVTFTALDFAATSSPDAVTVKAKTKFQRVATSLAINNRGTPLLGRTQMRGEVRINSAVRDGDTAAFTYSTPTDLERFRYASASYSVPLNDDGLRASLSLGRFETRPENLPIEGRADTLSVALTYPLRLRFTERIDLVASFDSADSENAAIGLASETSRTRVLRTAISQAKAVKKGSRTARAALSIGLDAFGAAVDPLRADADFVKLNVAAARERRIGKTFALRVSAAAQISGDALVSSEQFAIGGDEYGRAFANAAALGDQGIAASAELKWGGLKRTELYSFIDGGQVWSRARAVAPESENSLVSAGFGVRQKIGPKSSIGIEAARALKAPDENSRGDWRLTFSLRIAS